MNSGTVQYNNGVAAASLFLPRSRIFVCIARGLRAFDLSRSLSYINSNVAHVYCLFLYHNVNHSKMYVTNPYKQCYSFEVCMALLFYFIILLFFYSFWFCFSSSCLSLLFSFHSLLVILFYSLYRYVCLFELAKRMYDIWNSHYFCILHTQTHNFSLCFSLSLSPSQSVVRSFSQSVSIYICLDNWLFHSIRCCISFWLLLLCHLYFCCWHFHIYCVCFKEISSSYIHFLRIENRYVQRFDYIEFHHPIFDLSRKEPSLTLSCHPSLALIETSKHIEEK